MNTLPESLLRLLAESIRKEGHKVDYGGYVVYEATLHGDLYEIDACDFGRGRRISCNKQTIATLG